MEKVNQPADLQVPDFTVLLPKDEDQDGTFNLQIIMRDRGFVPELVQSTAVGLKVERGVVVDPGRKVIVDHDFIMLFDGDKYDARLSGCIPDFYKNALKVEIATFKAKETVKSTIFNHGKNALAIDPGRLISQICLFERANATTNATNETNAVDINMRVIEWPRSRADTWEEAKYRANPNLYNEEIAKLEAKATEEALTLSVTNKRTNQSEVVMGSNQW